MTKFLYLIAATTIWAASVTFATETTENAQAGTESGSESGSDPDGESGEESGTEKNAEQLSAVLAIEADTEYGAYLGGECLTCHAPSGGDGSIPLIHAKSKEYLASALLEYKNKQRANEVMQGVTAALSNEEIAALATYFSEQ